MERGQDEVDRWSTGASAGGVQRASCRSAAQVRRSADSMSRPDGVEVRGGDREHLGEGRILVEHGDGGRGQLAGSREASGGPAPRPRARLGVAARAPRRAPPAARAASAWVSAKPPAASATTSSTPAPASRPRRRRFVRRSFSTSRCVASRLASRNSRSVAFSSTWCSAAQSSAADRRARDRGRPARGRAAPSRAPRR